MFSNEVGSSGGDEGLSVSKQAACYACRRSKIKCARSPGAEACKKCASAGVECVVPSYHVGRYKGIKNKRSGLDKAIHQVEAAIKKAKSSGSVLPQKHTEALQKVINDSRIDNNIATLPHTEETDAELLWESAADVAAMPSLNSTSSAAMKGNHQAPELGNNSDVTVNNASNPLQLLAIASAIPEPDVDDSSPSLHVGVSPSMATAISTDEGRTQDFFQPMVSKLDIEKHLDPEELGLISLQEIHTLFDYFHDNLAHTRWGLDRHVHSVAFVRSRSAFLFTSILACAALFVPDAASLSTRLNNHSKSLARQVLSGSYRSVEIVLAFMISIPWMQPGKNWATDDQTCNYLSAAMTIALDLSLNKIITPSTTMRSQETMDRIATAEYMEAQRALNMDCYFEIDATSPLGRRLLRARERAWLALFTLDRGVCLARGRPWTVPTGPLIDTCDTWHISDIADPWDGSMIATAVLRRDFSSLIANVRLTCDSHRLAIDDGANNVKFMREKVEGFFAQWYHTWTYQIKQNDGTLPPYVEILVSHGKLSAYCNVINHPTASMEVKQFFRAAGLTAALHVIRTAALNETKLHSMPNNSVIMVSFAACFVLGLSTFRRQGNIYISDHVRQSVCEAADVLERIGSTPKHRKGASTLFGQHIKRILRLHTASPVSVDDGQSMIEAAPMNTTGGSGPSLPSAPYTLQPISDGIADVFPGFDSMTDDQLLEAIQNSRDSMDTFDVGGQQEDSLFMDWLDWPSIT